MNENEIPGSAGALLATDVALKSLRKDRAAEIVERWLAQHQDEPREWVIAELTACIHVLAVNYLRSAADWLAEYGHDMPVILHRMAAEGRRAVRRTES